MSDLSDLELVAHAMKATNKPLPPATVPPTANESSQPATADTSSQPPTLPSLPSELSDLDLSKLSASDLAVLQPLLDALLLSEDPEDDDLTITEILKQMDAAGDVADELEGKLDRLLENLGQAEKEIEEDVGEKVGGRGNALKEDEGKEEKE